MRRYLTILLLVSLSLVFTATASANEEIKAFTTVGTHSWDVPDNVDEVTVLVVGGGGGGPGYASGGGAGGGGAGGVAFAENYDISSTDTVSVEVGDGAPPRDTNSRTVGYNGEDSQFGNILAKGGGGGATSADGYDANNGGSGGGSSDAQASKGSGTQPGTNDANVNDYGNSGGGLNTNNMAGGGGGAGESGHADDGSKSGDGGQGVYFGDVFGDEYGENGYFAGGGGGGTSQNHNKEGGDGGLGGGGDGEGINNNMRGNGMPNTGGGGGGGTNWGTNSGGGGGSGIVLIKYSGDFSICDRRGPVNECISNSTHDISNQDYNISSIFQSEDSSVFEALTGSATLNLTNSTTISGIWKGSINIQTENPILKSGSSFNPKGERIIIGK